MMSEKVSSASPSPSSSSFSRRMKKLKANRSNSWSSSASTRSISRSPISPASVRRSPVVSRRRSRDKSYRDQNSRDRERDREQYTSICIKNLNENVDTTHLHDNIYYEFKKYGEFTIKIVNNKKSSSSHSNYTERIAFVNFNNAHTARAAKRDKMHKQMCGLPMYIEPVYKNYKPGTICAPPPPPPPTASVSYYPRRSRSPPRHSYRHSPPPPPPNRRSRSRSRNYRDKYPTSSYRPVSPVQNNHNERRHSYSRSNRRSSRTPPSLAPRTPPPPKHDIGYKISSRSRSRSRSSRGGASTNIHGGGVSHYFDNDEKDATRTLFIGNLDSDLEKEYLRRIFEKYGRVEEVDIKKSQTMPYMNNNLDMRKTYAFVRYENMDQAKQAKHFMNGKKVGSSEIKIGYGK